jgi:hypothetical protein
MDSVHAAFGTVLWIVLGVAAVIAILSLVMSSRTWSDFGRGGLVMDRDEPHPRGRAGSDATPVRERDEDIRSMLEARNARRIRRGEAAIDVEQELLRLTAPGAGANALSTGARRVPDVSAGATGEAAGVTPGPEAPAAVDPELAEEVRQLVVARNARRVRAGKPPLDIEAELARELRRVSEGFG